MLTVGSVCSGIEACSVAWKSFSVVWFSEIGKPQSLLLEKRYGNKNLGDMTKIPALLRAKKIPTVDILAGGTPCQAFSLSGLKKGLNDDRGKLTLEFIKIANTNDNCRLKEGKKRATVFWENVEGCLKDKTNAFGYFIAGLAGLRKPIKCKKWPNAGLVRGLTRNIAWRILDAKYFGLSQQRRRLYVVATDKSINPESILFEKLKEKKINDEFGKLRFKKNGHNFEVFREYTDCLFISEYGNSAAVNGSQYLAQDGKLRHLSVLERERLMGFPDNYTKIDGLSRSARILMLGNSWAVNVIKWIGKRIENPTKLVLSSENAQKLGKLEIFNLMNSELINSSEKPNNIRLSKLENIIDYSEEGFLTVDACAGCLCNAATKGRNLNPRFEYYLKKML